MNTDHYFALTNYSLLGIQGDLAKKFLQGQLTCNLEEILPTQSRLGAQCNPQGRIISLFRIFYFNNYYLLKMPKELMPIAISALKKYAVFFKNLKIEELPGYTLLGYSGTQLKKIFSPLPSQKDEVVSLKDSIIINVGLDRYEIITQQTDILAYFSKIATEQPTPFWKQLNIAENLSDIYPETSEMFLPHEINLPALNGVSFNKGCYTGQEIIARMEYRAKLKKQLAHFKVVSPTPPCRGADIFSDQKPQGNIVDYSQLSYNSYEILAIIPGTNNSTLFLDLEQKYSLEA